MRRPNLLRGFLTELRRRRVHTVAAMYAAAAFVVLQVADLAIEPLRLPEWTMALLIVLALAGLGLALVLAWMFQTGPDGITRAPSVLATSGRASRNMAYVGLGVLIGLIAVGGYTFINGPELWGRGAESTRITSIAVLPFLNVGGEPGEEYFGDGLAEELLDALANIEQLRVPARTSSFAFKGQQLDVREIGRRLRVEAVLEGSVRRAGDRLRVTAQLVDVESGFTRFSETYDRTADDVFAVQEELSRAILAAIDLDVADDDDDGAVVGSTTADSRAHDDYLAGLFNFHRRGESIDSAITRFSAAVGADPDYADAWAGLASAYSVAPYFVEITPDSARSAGGRAARHALALDPSNAQAHAALGQMAANFDWDFAGAVRHYEQALAVAPASATTRQWLAESYYRLGRVDEALAQLEQARALDPLSPILAQQTGIVLAAAGRLEDALAELDRGHRLDSSGFTVARAVSATLLVRLGRCDEAVRLATERLQDDDERASTRLFYAAPCDATLRPQARAAADRAAQAAEAGEPGAPSASDLALMYDLIGETAQAELWFLRAYVNRDPSLPDLISYGTGEELRRRPAVHAALREMGMDWIVVSR